MAVEVRGSSATCTPLAMVELSHRGPRPGLQGDHCAVRGADSALLAGGMVGGAHLPPAGDLGLSRCLYGSSPLLFGGLDIPAFRSCRSGCIPWPPWRSGNGSNAGLLAAQILGHGGLPAPGATTAACAHTRAT